MNLAEGGATQLEPYSTVQFLPSCPFCGDRHPLAYQPPHDPGSCPTCGNSAVQPQDAVEVPATVVGHSPAMLTARAMFAVGKALNALARKL